MLVKVLEGRHPTFDGKALTLKRALYEGGETWRQHVSEWLPQHPEEMDDNYEARKKRALYENHAGPIIDILASAVFTEPPGVEGLRGSWLAEFLGNVDREGTGLGPWCRERLVDALVEQVVYAWVNLPARPADAPPPASRADEEAAGLLSAFLVPFTARQVIDWEHDENGGLAWLMVRDVVERRPGPEALRSRVHRWTYIDRRQIRRWTWTATPERADPSDEDDATEQPPVLHGLGELPVARLSLTDGLYAMGKLRDPAVAHTRARNDLSWALHRAAHALLVIKSKWDPEKPTLGPGRFLRLGPDDDAFYVEPSGSNFQLLADDLVQLREGLYRVVHQMAIGADSNATRSKMSGESKAQDWAAMDIVLGALAEATRTFLVDVLRLVAVARGERSPAPVVTGLGGWREEDVEAWLTAAALATEAFRMSPTFQREVAKRQVTRVLDGADAAVLKTIGEEIDAAEVDPAPYLPPRPPGQGDDDDTDEE